MPLNRDQPPEPNTRVTPPSAPIVHQHTRSIGPDLSLRSRPSTPQNGMNSTSIRREHANPIVPDGGRRYRLDDEGPVSTQPAAYEFKMPAVDTMQKYQVVKSQHSVSTRLQGPNPKQENLRGSTNMTKPRRAEKQKSSAFDDTASLNESILEGSLDAQTTAVLNLKPQEVEHYFRQETEHAREHDQSLEEDIFANLEPDWQNHVADERRLRGERASPTPHTLSTYADGEHADSRPPKMPVLRHEGLQEPDTPTRSQSVPPAKAQLHAPAPRKTVGWAGTNQFHRASPSFRSSELVEEDSFQQPVSRPNSAQPRVHMISEQQAPRMHQHLHNQPRQTHSVVPSQSGRFRGGKGHPGNVRQESEKVSAPESDNQDFSEDERTQTRQQYSQQEELLDTGITVPQSLPSRKRSHDDVSNDLDYSHDELKKSTLSALQAEAFTRDPRAGVQPPPTDSVGNEMTLPQILENLSKVPEHAQRETFKSLTDEQWAKTGQWFVDKFQADLKKLTETRLQRRQIALKYEDTIRRRQRLVEHHEAELNKELKELQTGGKQLVDGRKIPGGSRTGTPMKGGR